MGEITEKNYKELEESDSYDAAKLTGMLDDKFRDVLLKMLGKKHMTQADITRISNIGKGYLSDLFSGKKKNPAREKVLDIGLALNCTEDEMNELLRSAGYSPLYSKFQLDSVIIFGLTHGKTGLEIRELLYDNLKIEELK